MNGDLDLDLDARGRDARLQEIRDICESRAFVAKRLQNFKFENADQLERAREYVDRYQRLVQRIEKLNLPISRQIQVHLIDGGRPSTSASLLSVSTPSSQIDISADDLDSDLQSVQSEVIRYEGERLAQRQPELERDFVQQLAETITASTDPETV